MHRTSDVSHAEQQLGGDTDGGGAAGGCGRAEKGAVVGQGHRAEEGATRG